MTYALVVTVIVTLVVSLAVVALWQEKQRYRERASIATRNVAQLLDQHISDVFDKVDVVLQSIVFQYRDEPPQSGPGPKGLNAYLAQQKLLIPEILSLGVIDKDGIVRFGSDVPVGSTISVADRDFFLRARANPTPELLISEPIFGRITRQWVIVFARRLNGPDGSFAGVAYVNFATTYFEKVFSSIELGRNGAATLRTTELALVHRFPSTKGGVVGSKDVSQELRDIVNAHPEGNEYIAATALDGIERSNAYRKLHGYPFYVIVGLATDDYLGGWKNNILMVSGLAGLAILITMLAAILDYRSTRRLTADIAERKRLGAELERLLSERTQRTAELTAANWALEAFSYSVAHDLRAPLRAIHGHASIIAEEDIDKLDDSGRAHLRRIQGATERMAQLIDSVLRLSRITRTTIRRENVDLSLFAREIARQLARDSGRNVEFAIGDGVTAHADANLMHSAMENLLRNAWKFTRARPQARIEFGSTTVDGEPAYFVRDDGVGFDPAYADKLFEPFQRLHDQNEYEGSGIGLTIVRRIIEHHRGRVWAEGAVGHGAVFYFTLPATRTKQQH